MNLEEAVRVASEAGERIAASEGDDAAADYLADASEAVWGASFNPLAWRLAQQGLRYVGKRRDFTWFRLCGLDLTRREAEDPDAPGIQLDAPERRELAEVMERDPEVQEAADRGYTLTVGSVSSREELRTRFASALGWRAFSAGEYRQFRQRYADDADAALAKGQLALAAFSYTLAARLEGALGNLEASERSYALACELAERLPPLPFLAMQMSVVPMEHDLVRREASPEAFLSPVEQALSGQGPGEPLGPRRLARHRRGPVGSSRARGGGAALARAGSAGHRARAGLGRQLPRAGLPGGEHALAPRAL